MNSILGTLAGLPAGLLYPILFAVAAIENIVPPFPADVVVAFGAFIAAQGSHLMAFVFLFAWIGNVSGASLVYYLGRRFGAKRLERQIAGDKASTREARFREMFDRYGLPALFLTRFVPGVRALVPVAAGTLKLPFVQTVALVGAASAVWYGAIIFVAFRVGNNWGELSDDVVAFSRTLGIAAVALLALALVIWALLRRRKSAT